MDIKSVEVISLEAAAALRRQARRAKREESERREKMTMRDVMNLFWVDLSTLRARAALYGDEPLESPSPPVLNYEEDERPESAIVRLAQANAGKAVLVEFTYEPSKMFEDRLRSTAKDKKLVPHFYRLTGGWIILEVQRKQTPEEADASLLKRMGVQW